MAKLVSLTFTIKPRRWAAPASKVALVIAWASTFVLPKRVSDFIVTRAASFIVKHGMHWRVNTE